MNAVKMTKAQALLVEKDLGLSAGTIKSLAHKMKKDTKTVSFWEVCSEAFSAADRYLILVFEALGLINDTDESLQKAIERLSSNEIATNIRKTLFLHFQGCEEVWDCGRLVQEKVEGLRTTLSRAGWENCRSYKEARSIPITKRGQAGAQENALDLLAWMLAEDKDHPFSFRHCCETMGFNYQDTVSAVGGAYPWVFDMVSDFEDYVAVEIAETQILENAKAGSKLAQKEAARISAKRALRKEKEKQKDFEQRRASAG